MKKIALLLAISSSTIFAFAQSENEKKENKIETIKIINGDTVVHDVRIVEGDVSEMRHKRRMHIRHESRDHDISDEVKEILEDIDVYVNLDDAKKEMIIKRLSDDDEEFEMIIENWTDDDDMVIDMKDGKKVVKVIKIEIDNENGEEVKVIEKKVRQGKDKDGVRIREESNDMGRKQGIGVFPNPAKDKLNVSFSVLKDNPAELTITNVDGKQIFKKTYEKAGQASEVVDIKNEKKGLYVITLTDKNRTISRKIIIE